MTVKEAKEIIESMELSKESMKTIDVWIKDYKDEDELPEELLDRILKVVDKEMDITKLESDVVDDSILDLDEKIDKNAK